MSYINNFLINFFNKKVGKDIYANGYYESTKSNYLGTRKRLIIYSKMNRKMKISPAWHAWLHYLTDEIPNEEWYIRTEESRVSNSISQKYNRWYPQNIKIE